ncbi:membrane metalloprotease [Aliifodinibius salipaludis]|uniref:Membrane metalloprotease n=1 Tax=Fodinibius salipaludis TaxID=2032627 RepID=A0A2A2GC01_9BACT|nr:membrane metalloprotease [Aliifodinibius salipaludis]PAU95236.1 membrane metalloprotease [Aliifodinibius salipaludis]
MRLFKRVSVFILCFSLAIFIYSCSDSSTDPGDPSQEEFNSKAGTGESAEHFLQSDTYSNIEIELDYMEGYKPTEGAIDSLESFLNNRLNKNSITINTSKIPARGDGPYSTEMITTIEEDERDNYTEASGSTLHAYIVVVDGELSDNPNVLGIAYWNTSMALFGETIDNISSSDPTSPSEQQVENTVLRHEVGHNMGLVGNGTPTQSDHKTEDSAHCTNDECLMAPSVQTGDIFQNISGDVPSLDEACIQDLKANGGK